MAKTRQEIFLGLRKLRSELRKTSDGKLRETCLAGIDDLLDAQLDLKGVHPADCGCWECRRAVADVLARRVNQDPRDTATVDEWGAGG